MEIFRKIIDIHEKIVNNQDSIFAPVRAIWILFLITFLIWIYCFKGFALNEFYLESDAIAYFDHFRYFVDNISRGIYPMWEPTRSTGVPVDFFMRRIGAYNPTYSLILILDLIGLPYAQAYLLFLSMYYFLGMIGFYFIAKLIFNDRRSAFLAYLLLMFSSLATRPFDSYITLTVIPMIWFFFFLLSFRKASNTNTKIISKI